MSAGTPTARLEADAWYPGQNALVVRGTVANDTIALTRQSGYTAVTANGASLGTFLTSGLSRIVVYGVEGDDRITFGAGINKRAYLDGGSGNDYLQGGDAADMILGGLGSDTLLGGAGNDVLIGGDGADNLNGGDGSDLLIAGRTSHDALDAALRQIYLEWTSGLSYTNRVNRLSAGIGGVPALNASTVFNDGSLETLTGGLSNDWFIADVARALLKDRASGERLN